MAGFRTALFAALLIALSTTSATAQQGTFKGDPSSGAEAGGCITSGSVSLGTYFRTCTTSLGTLSQITGLPGATNISTEGYALCAPGTHAVDNAGNSVGFNAPTTTTPSSNVRTTTDGRFKLSQTFTRDAAEKEMVITMTVRNQTTTAIAGVELARFVDADIASSATGDSYSAMRASVVAHEGYVLDGLSLSARTLNFLVQTDIEAFVDYDPISSGCFASNAVYPTTPTAHGDWTGWVTYLLGTINAGASKVVKFVYRLL